MGTIPASENEFPEVLLAEGAAPAAPGANLVKVYAKSDGLPDTKDDAGAESPMTPNAHIADATDAHDATAVSFDPTGATNITAIEVQGALDELDAAIAGGGIPVTIIDAAGDLIVGTAADTAARLAIGATNGMALMRVGGALAWAFPTGHEIDYVAFTGNVSVTNTTEATADTVVTGSAIAYDGSTAVWIEFSAEYIQPAATAGASISVWVYDGSSSIGRIQIATTPAASTLRVPAARRIKITPSAATHTYSIRASVSTGTGTVAAGAGGAGVGYPGFIRITKA